MPKSYRRQISRDVALEQLKVRERERWWPLLDLEIAFSPRRAMRTEELGEIRKGLRVRQLVPLLLCALGCWHSSRCLLTSGHFPPPGTSYAHLG